MYGEDMELALRARALGYRPLVTPDATVTHVLGASSSDEGRQMTWILRGRVGAMRRHWSPARRRLGVLLLLTGVLLRAVRARLTGHAPFWLGAWRRRAEWVAGW
jgi:GT2 family glycosyltransferase